MKLVIEILVCKGNKIVAQIVYEITEPEYADDGNVMGIDLGIKCPAVSFTSDGNIKFYGNGRKNKYLRRHYKYLRKKLQKAKHIAYPSLALRPTRNGLVSQYTWQVARIPCL